MGTLPAFLRKRAEGDLLPWSCQVAAAERFETSLGRVEETALELGLLPARYQRNRQIISVSGQLALFRSKVAVIGCGGLGGYVIEQLARLGVGGIIAVDPDVFEEHNLNRQILSRPGNLGAPKVEAARRRVSEINPAVTLVPIQAAINSANGRELLHDAHIVVDALDSIPVRLELAETCEGLDIPLVHGAIAGWYGNIVTQFPGDGAIETVYRNWVEGKGIEKNLGNPSFTPAVVASLETAEVCKIILGEGEPLRGRKLAVDLLSMEFHEVGLCSVYRDDNEERKIGLSHQIRYPRPRAAGAV
jgi:molybdopterin/thiamine biosynthesis adenylyltransferase